MGFKTFITEETSGLKKTTWNAFIEKAKEGLQYNGSAFDKTKEHMAEMIKKQGPNLKWSVDRKLKSGSSVLRWESGSVLDKKGTVWELDDHGYVYFIIDSKMGDSANHVVYRYKK